MPLFPIKIKIYTALITQSSTAAPTVKLLHNTYNDTISWIRTNVGIYQGTLEAAFPANKTYITLTPENATVVLRRIDNDNIEIQTIDPTTAGNVDTRLSDSPIEVRSYI